MDQIQSCTKTLHDSTQRYVYNELKSQKSRCDASSEGSDKQPVKLFTRRHLRKRINVGNGVKLTRKRKAVKKIIKLWVSTVMHYEKAISEGPTGRCWCCDRLCFPSSLKWLDFSDMEKLHGLSFVEKVFCVSKSSATFCQTCSVDIKKGKIPSLCVSDGLQFSDVPSCLQLTKLEERCVAARIPFMQIRALGIDRQLGLKGGVINVPVDIDEMVSRLPRPYSETSTVLLRLKRKMIYSHHYMQEKICPKAVIDAAAYLVTQPLYIEKKITLSDNWLTDEAMHGFPVIDCLEPNAGVDYIEEHTDPSNLTLAGEIDVEVADEELFAAEQESMIDNDSNLTIAMAPGENKLSKHILFDDDAEELAFPTIYCGNKRRLNRKLSYSDIAKSEIRRFDRRCARVEKIFYMYKKSQLHRTYQHIGVALRKKKKGKTHDLTVSSMLDTAVLNELIQHDDGYRFLLQDRHSPAHWQNEQRNLFAMIMQFGLPTLFITLSAAETKWPELLIILKQTVDKEIVTAADVEEISFLDRCRLIRADPVTCCIYFEYRCRKLIETWNCTGGPFGEHKITHFYRRVEFQHRGSPHLHMMIWLENAPIFIADNHATHHNVESFIDSMITCSASNPITSKLTTLQTHRHSQSCRRVHHGKVICRFNIPFFPMDKTRILLPLNLDTENDYSSTLEIVRLELQNVTSDTPDFYEWLNILGIELDRYIMTVRSTLTKPKIFLKRQPSEISVNAYSEKILSLHRANMDIQFILDPYFCATYVVNYTTKANRSMSILLRKCVDQARDGNKPLKEKFQQMANVIYYGSEVSSQEASYTVLGLPMSKSSEKTIFIPTGLPEGRVRMLKTKKHLEALDPQSTEIFYPNILQHYSKRPDCMWNVTLAEFAAYYSGKSSNSSANEFMIKRKRPRVIRYRRYNIKTDPDNFYREQLMLFHPWKNEESELLDVNCIEEYFRHYEKIKLVRKHFVYEDYDELELALHEQIENEFSTEEELLSNEKDGEFLLFEPDVDQHKPDVVKLDDRSCFNETGKFKLPNYTSESEYCSIIQCLNEEQRDFLYHVVNKIKSNETPSYYFVSGSAGTGKSLLIKALYQSILRIFTINRGVDPSEIPILMIAPTGKAAFNIGGMTAHQAFSLPYNQCSDLVELSASVANTISARLINLKVLIIDEISMLGARQFSNIDRRLRQIFRIRKPFGGISVFVFGDFRQLHPVGDKLVFKAHGRKDDLTSITGPILWEMFQIFELTQIMRQKEDGKFALALNNLASGSMDANDIKLLRSRCFNENTLPKDASDAIHLFARNDEVDFHNNKILDSMNTERAESIAVDLTQGTGSERSRTSAKNVAALKSSKDTAGLPYKLVLRLQARYMVTANVDTTDGIVNGATGRLQRIDYGCLKGGNDIRVRRIWVQFDDASVGIDLRQKFHVMATKSGYLATWTPIERIIRSFTISKTSNLQIFREQFPIVPAEAMTVHKSQGGTYSKVVVTLKRAITRQLLYVACSRAINAKGLYILGQFNAPLRPDDKELTIVEMARLRQNPLIPCFTFLRTKHNCVQFMFHNIQSLHKH